MSSPDVLAEPRLTVVLDLRYPQSYLALNPAIEFAREQGVSVDWLPLAASPLKPPPPAEAGSDRSIRHRRFRALRIAEEIRVYAAAQSLDVREIYRAKDATVFNLAWLFMRRHAAEGLLKFLGEGFRAYWSVEFDPDSEGQVCDLITEAGGDAADFRVWCRDQARDEYAQTIESLHARGVFAVPSYLVDDEVYLGRQHLPMIRWILAGRSGKVPI